MVRSLICPENCEKLRWASDKLALCDFFYVSLQITIDGDPRRISYCTQVPPLPYRRAVRKETTIMDKYYICPEECPKLETRWVRNLSRRISTCTYFKYGLQHSPEGEPKRCASCLGRAVARGATYTPRPEEPVGYQTYQTRLPLPEPPPLVPCLAIDMEDYE